MRRKTSPLALMFLIIYLLVWWSIVYPSLIPILITIIALTIFWCYRYRKRYKVRVETLEELRALSPSEFERAIATLLEDLGYRKVRITGGIGDLSRDLACEDTKGHNIMVQCKRYISRKVSSSEMQKFIGMMITEYMADKGIYITTSSFTEPARKLARKRNIELWDGEKLADILIKQQKLHKK